MGEILGLGVTHVPLLAGRDADMTRILRRILKGPGLPERYRRPEGWPEAMRKDWADDEGLAAAGRHREALVAEFRKARRVLDEFAPDFVIVWGDDQYENFKDDIFRPLRAGLRRHRAPALGGRALAQRLGRAERAPRSSTRASAPPRRRSWGA